MQFYSFTPQYGFLLGAAVTATTAAGAIALLTLDRDRRSLKVFNGSDAPVMVTYNGANFDYLPAGVGQVWDLGANALQAASGLIIGAYNLGAAPTTGRVTATAI